MGRCLLYHCILRTHSSNRYRRYPYPSAFISDTGCPGRCPAGSPPWGRSHRSRPAAGRRGSLARGILHPHGLPKAGSPMFVSCQLFSFGTVCRPAAQPLSSSTAAKSSANTLRYIVFPPFRGIRAHSALSQSCLLPRPGRRTGYSSDPRTQPKPVESHGLDVTAQVPVVQPT